jgi:hypothetical protein
MEEHTSSVRDMGETTDVILVHLQHIREAQEDLKAGQRETNNHLRELNGRMYKAEGKIGGLEATAERRRYPSNPRPGVRDMSKGRMSAAIIAALIALAGALEGMKALFAAVGQALAK